MAADDEAIQMEENGNNSKQDQSEVEPDWEEEENGAKDSKNAAATREQSIWKVT